MVCLQSMSSIASAQELSERPFVQIWRIITNFCFLGKFGWPFVMNLIFMVIPQPSSSLLLSSLKLSDTKVYEP